MKIPGKSCDVPSSKPMDRDITSARRVRVTYVRVTPRIFTTAVIKILQRVRSVAIVPFD